MRILYKTVWRQKIVWIPFSAFLIIAAVISQISSFMLLSWREQNLEISTSYKLNFTIKSTVQPDTFYIKKSEVPLMFSSSLVSSQYTPTRIFSYIEQPVTKVEWGAEAAGAYKRSDTENMVIMQTIKDIESVSEFISGQLFIQEISQNVYEGQIPIYISNRLAAANQWEIDDIITIEVPGIQSIPYECQIYAIFYNTDDVAWMASDYNGK